jgi:hypothetical protein
VTQGLHGGNTKENKFHKKSIKKAKYNSMIHRSLAGIFFIKVNVARSFVSLYFQPLSNMPPVFPVDPLGDDTAYS